VYALLSDSDEVENSGNEKKKFNMKVPKVHAQLKTAKAAVEV
jgi:hypothetical protein